MFLSTIMTADHTPQRQHKNQSQARPKTCIYHKQHQPNHDRKGFVIIEVLIETFAKFNRWQLMGL